jgi:hypothetical protein
MSMTAMPTVSERNEFVVDILGPPMIRRSGRGGLADRLLGHLVGARRERLA